MWAGFENPLKRSKINTMRGTPTAPTADVLRPAGLAQLVERDPSKLDVASSNLAPRSNLSHSVAGDEALIVSVGRGFDSRRLHHTGAHWFRQRMKESAEPAVKHSRKSERTKHSTNSNTRWLPNSGSGNRLSLSKKPDAGSWSSFMVVIRRVASICGFRLHGPAPFRPVRPSVKLHLERQTSHQTSSQGIRRELAPMVEQA